MREVRGRSGSPAAGGRSTRTTPRSTARSRSASWCRAERRTWWRRWRSVAAAGRRSGRGVRHRPRRADGQRGRPLRLLQVHEPAGRARPGVAARPRAAGDRPRPPPRGGLGARADLRPDPATHSRCTLGGMIGKNSAAPTRSSPPTTSRRSTSSSTTEPGCSLPCRVDEDELAERTALVRRRRSLQPRGRPRAGSGGAARPRRCAGPSRSPRARVALAGESPPFRPPLLAIGV
jgi:hypothetical protein